jgi:putative copper export protein
MVSLIAQTIPAAIANPTPPLWRVASKAGYFVGWIGVIGGTVLYLLVLRPLLSRVSASLVADRVVLERRFAQLLAATGAFFLVALYFQLAAVITRGKGPANAHISYGQALEPAAIWRYMSAPGGSLQWISPGAMTGVQYGLWAIAAIVLMLLWAPRFRAQLARVTSLALAITLVSHQLSLLATPPPSLDNAVDTVANHIHVIAVSVWIGGVAGLAALAGVRNKLSADAGVLWVQLWSRFGTVALVAVGCIVISGLYMAWDLVGSPAELLTTKFGNVLLVKVTLVAAAVMIGGCHEFFLLPRMARARAAGDRGSLFGLALRTAPLLAATEATLGAGALLAMTFLNGSARTQAGDATPALSYNVIGLGIILAAGLAGSFVITAKLSERLAAGSAQPTSA